MLALGARVWDNKPIEADTPRRTQMNKIERASRLDQFLSDDDNFVAVEYNDPRAIELRNRAAKRWKARQRAAAKRAAEDVACAAKFALGQSVRAGRHFGEVVAVGENTVLFKDASGVVRKCAASMVVAA
jgi:hypothetical protein